MSGVPLVRAYEAGKTEGDQSVEQEGYAKMKTEEAIKNIVTYGYYQADELPLQVAKALDMAVAALRAQQEAEKNEPLTAGFSVVDTKTGEVSVGWWKNDREDK